MVDSQVTLLVDGSQLKLVGSHLIMARLTGNGQFKGLNLEILHKGLYTIRNGAEIVIVHLLVLRTLMPHQRTTCQHQIRTGGIESFINEEIFLFPTQIDTYLVNIVVEILADVNRCFVDGVERTQQRGFVVEGFACIGDEDGGDTESVVDDKHR